MIIGYSRDWDQSSVCVNSIYQTQQVFQTVILRTWTHWWKAKWIRARFSQLVYQRNYQWMFYKLEEFNFVINMHDKNVFNSKNVFPITPGSPHQPEFLVIPRYFHHPRHLGKRKQLLSFAISIIFIFIHII